MRKRLAMLLVTAAAQWIPSAQAIDLFVADKVIVESGRDTFKNYCARCHGADARGGPVKTDTGTVQAPDLTTLAQRNGGTLPVWGVYEVVSGTKVLKEHGTRTMPLWGKEFGKLKGLTKETRDSVVRGRIMAILAYLSTIQAK